MIGLNLVMLALGCAGGAFLLRRSFHFSTSAIILIGILTLSCWVFVKHATLPLSDLPYFGISMACLAILRWSIDQSVGPRVCGMGFGIVFLLAAIAVRTVGIALLPALALACLPGNMRGHLPERFRKHRARTALLLVVFLAVAAAVGVAVTQSRYVKEMTDEWVGWRELARYRFEDWGELVINTSMAKLPGSLQRIVPFLGGLGALIACWGAARRARLELVDAYVLGYTGILLVWPYRDARFWLPVWPFLAAYVCLAYARAADCRIVRRAGAAYVCAFCLMGGLALVYSSRISLSGERFADVYAGGVYRGSYRASSGAQGGVKSANDDVDPKLVQLIERYGCRY